jgi:hypothetical protein
MRKSILIRTVLATVFVIAIAFVAFIVPTGINEVLSGRATAQAYISYTPPKNCSVRLVSGVNMVSFYCEGAETPINESLVGINNTSLDYSSVFLFNPNDLNDSWSSYNPSLPGWATQSLSTISRKYGYAIIMNQPGMYYREGYKFANNQIPLQIGWNFIGYPDDTAANITTVLAQIDGKYTRAEAYDTINNSGVWLLYVPGTGGTLTTMQPMLGYWIEMNESATLVIG